jgi:hypothetical protein
MNAHVRQRVLLTLLCISLAGGVAHVGASWVTSGVDTATPLPSLQALWGLSPHGERTAASGSEFEEALRLHKRREFERTLDAYDPGEAI